MGAERFETPSIKSSTVTTSHTKIYVKLFYIMIGIPCSGKSTWIKERLSFWQVLSRDTIREEMANGKYVFDSRLEAKVTDKFDDQLEEMLLSGRNIVIDNTNLRMSYIIDLRLKAEQNGYTVVCIKMDVPYWKALYRNIVRRVKTGKWIPFKVMKKMKKNFNKLDWKQIAKKTTLFDKNFKRI